MHFELLEGPNGVLTQLGQPSGNHIEVGEYEGQALRLDCLIETITKHWGKQIFAHRSPKFYKNTSARIFVQQLVVQLQRGPPFLLLL